MLNTQNGNDGHVLMRIFTLIISHIFAVFADDAADVDVGVAVAVCSLSLSRQMHSSNGTNKNT